MGLEKIYQDNIIKKLIKLGFNYIPGKELNKERLVKNKIILDKYFDASIRKINHKIQIDDNYLDSLKNQLNKFQDGNLYEINKNITKNYIQNPTTKKINGKEKNIFLVDYEKIENNSFVVTDEFIFESNKGKVKRPDLVIFINGMPVIFFELKSFKEEIGAAIGQMINNQIEVEELFKFSQILITANEIDAKYATTKASRNFYNSFASENSEKEMYKFLKPENLLEIIKDFILFNEDKKNNKIIAKYNQIRAVRKSLDHFLNKKQKSGVIWHTQGSGKSLTMVFLASKILKTFNDSKIIVVTDRKELDQQIFDTYKNSVKKYSVDHAKSARELIKKIDNQKYTILTSLVHKFAEVDLEAIEKNKLADSKNIFVFVDEAHRTQSSMLHRKMKIKLPNANFIGFTGTPLLAGKNIKKSTKDTFGEYIDQYSISEAIKDKTILNLFYSHSKSKINLKDAKKLDQEVESELANLSILESEEEKSKYENIRTINETNQVINDIGKDIANDLKKYTINKFSGMLTTVSRYAAAKYYEYFSLNHSDLRVGFVVSEPEHNKVNEGKDFNENKEKIEIKKQKVAFYLKQWKSQYKKYNSDSKKIEAELVKKIKNQELDLIIVVDKLLTGFDCPTLQVMYLAKVMRSHNLLQAIARVNRVAEGKEAGIIVDYMGIIGKLQKALYDYSQEIKNKEDLTNIILSFAEAFKQLETEYQVITKIIGQDIKKPNLYKKLKDYEVRDKFYKAYRKALNALSVLNKVVVPDLKTQKEIILYEKKLKIIYDIYLEARKRHNQREDSKEEINLFKILNKHITTDGEVRKYISDLKITDENFFNQIKHDDSEIKMSVITASISNFLEENQHKDPAAYKKFSEKIEEILDQYRKGILHFNDLEKSIIKFIKNLNKVDKSNLPEQIRKNNALSKIYLNVKETLKTLKFDEKILIDITIYFDQVFKNNVSDKWNKNEQKKTWNKEQNVSSLCFW